MQTLRALLVLAAAVLLAGCGDMKIENPGHGQSHLGSPLTVALRSTDPWRLTAVTLDGQSVTDQFDHRSGGPNQVTKATLAMASGEHRLTAKVRVGVNEVTRTHIFSIGLPPQGRITLTAPTDGPVFAPVEVSVSGDFLWQDLSVESFATNEHGGWTPNFDRRSGRPSEVARARLPMTPKNHRIIAHARDVYGRFTQDEQIVMVVKGEPPLCNVPLYCGTQNHIAPGAKLGPQCGGGAWRYEDSSRDRCVADGGDYSRFTPERNHTVCDTGRRMMVQGQVTCVTQGGSSRSPPEAPTRTSDAPGDGQCSHTCFRQRPEDKMPICEPGQRRVPLSIWDSTEFKCKCEPCP